MDASGNLVEKYEYDPYGRTYITAPDGPARPVSAYGNPFAWTGQRYDPAVRLYHFWARSYWPTLGRWLQRDPLGYVDGVGLYEYVGGQATEMADPLGLAPNPPEAIGGFEDFSRWIVAPPSPKPTPGTGPGYNQGFNDWLARDFWLPYHSDDWLQSNYATGELVCGAALVPAAIYAAEAAALAALNYARQNPDKVSQFGNAVVDTLMPEGGPSVTQVTSWAGVGKTPDLYPGRWVMVGGRTWWNYFWTGLWGPKYDWGGSFPRASAHK